MSHTDQEPPIEYRDISATESLVYCLNYTIPSVIAEFTGIPDDTLYSTAQPGLLPAVWLMAHLAMYEHQLIQKAFQLNDNVPEALLLCTKCRR